MTVSLRPAKTVVFLWTNQEILLLKGTKQQRSVYDSMACRFFHAFLAFQFRTCLVIKGLFTKKHKQGA
jgi:hypothetical protein